MVSTSRGVDSLSGSGFPSVILPLLIRRGPFLQSGRDKSRTRIRPPPRGGNLAKQQGDAAARLRAEGQKIENVGPVLAVRVSVADEGRGDRVAISLLEDERPS